ncbi:MAG: DUF4394 domain-containing protein, partial [Terriglobales bacterium]
MLRSNRTNSWSFFCAALLAVLVLMSAPAAQAQSTIYAVDSLNNLLRFSSATPGTINATVAITGLQVGERIRGIDFRPADGQLYAIGTAGAAGPRLYRINTTTGAATAVGAAGAIVFSGLFPGADFNPVADRLRVVSDLDANLRVNPADGTAVTDTPVAYDAADVNAGMNAVVTGVAYDNNVAGAASTTLFVIDVNLDVLARQGSVGGAPTSPNSGLLFTIGLLGANFTNGSLDIAPNGTAFASDGVAANSSFYTVNLGTGLVTAVGPIGTMLTIDAIAVEPPPPSITINDVTANEGANAVFTVTLSAATRFQVSVNFATANGTAIAGSDYTTTAGTLNIAAGALTGTISVPLLFDAVSPEPNETYFVNLTMPVNATIADSQGLGTIINVAPNFTMTVTPASQTVLPGQSATYTVTITPAPFVPSVDVTCSTSIPLGGCTPPGTLTPANGTAVTSGTLTATTSGFFTVGQQNRPQSQAPLYAWWLPLSGFGALGLVLVGTNRKRLSGNRRAQFLAILSLLLAITLLAGCPLGRDRQDEGTPGGTYPITVTATGGGVTQTATVNVVVQG